MSGVGVELRHGGGVAADRDRVRAVDRDHCDFLGRELLERLGDLAGAGVVEPDDPGDAAVDVDLGEHLADAADIVGEVGDDDRAAPGGDRAVAADQRPERVDRRRRVDIADAQGLGGQAAWASPPRSAERRRRGRAGNRLDSERPARGRHRDVAVGPERRQEQLEIFAARQRPLGHHRHPPLHRRVDDEGAPGHPRRVLDEGADVGVAQIEHVLARRRRRQREGQSQGDQETLHGTLTRIGTARPPRSTMTLAGLPGAPSRGRRSAILVTGWAVVRICPASLLAPVRPLSDNR